MGQRIYFLDTARAVSILLGLPLHASYAYSSGEPWLIKSHATFDIFYVVSQFIHGFRMHAFFLIAGYFSALTLCRNDSRWLSKRMERLAIPLIATLFTFNIAQFLIVKMLNPGAIDRANEAGKIGSVWSAHMWFLIAMIFYTIMLYILPKTVWHDRSRYYAKIMIAHPLSSLIICITAIIFWTLGTKFALSLPPFKIFSATTMGIFPLFKIASYLPFFTFGVLCYTYNELFERITRWNNLAIGFSVIAVLLHALLPSGTEPILTVLRIILAIFSGIGGSYLTLALSRRFLNIKNETVSSIVNASFSIYLFHHPFIVIGTALLSIIMVPVGIGFPALILFALSAAWGLHLIIRNSRLLLWLFNGSAEKSWRPTHIAPSSTTSS
ncbi:acyltransferase family protein [Sphingobium sp. WCS2017Hpa-17]|uniref:acyltransferase family protein n=1 Tax=Sphingobium sp. WCS2017Hpa-17 TaxID=3073638 RepID=UPI00288A49C2|nr:acyltransferase family protein [Sphingobium sp. WCS2017Hpa-17]